MFRRGERLTAAQLNALAARVSAAALQAPLSVRLGSLGAFSRRPASRPSSGGIATLVWAAIVSRSGTAPPYRYAAVEYVQDSNGAWTAKVGGATFNNVFNAAEQGTGGQWVSPLNVGDVVPLSVAPGDNAVETFTCIRDQNRGTY